ncbi:hypothetical protein [Dysgonomonas sp. 25]|uniref:hypothetical protein n=1 Tax=Dysgonomonas sp. 25 TaxID=2302933 RepID=UPI0013CF8067|nr:hypothetical protein [Dysgonomonas sp. 25]NDV68574.1 hypothetical protein [Dysgonomonas sp. 25]
MINKELEDFCCKLHIQPSELSGTSQKQPLPLYRAVFSYLMYPTYTQTQIGRLFNRKPSAINTSMSRLKDALSVGDKSVIRIFDILNINPNFISTSKPEFNSFSKQVYEANKLKGFHDTIHPDKHHLCLIVSELMEAIEADRKGRRANLLKYEFCMDKVAKEDKDATFPKYFREYIKDTVEDELADAVIRLFDFAGARSYDLSNIPFSSNQKRNSLFTESIWDIIIELVACEEEEAVFCAIRKIEELCKILNINLWKHVELKLKYNKYRPYRHDKLY